MVGKNCFCVVAIQSAKTGQRRETGGGGRDTQNTYAIIMGERPFKRIKFLLLESYHKAASEFIM